MWIFVLVSMVIPITRKRSEEQDSSQLRIQSVGAGSSSKTVQQSTRKRNRRLPNIEANAPTVTSIPQLPDAFAPIPQPPNAVALIPQPPDLVAPIPHQDADQPPVNPPKRRGASLNLKATKTLENLPEGSKISLTMDTQTKGFVGPSSIQFAAECGIVMRNECPMDFHKWESISKDDLDLMYEKLEGKFNLLRSDKVFMEHVNDKLHKQWKRTRGKLSAHWKQNGGKTNPKLARKKMKADCRSQADWNHLCDYWELEKTRKYNDQMEANRGKQVIASRGGSRSIANHIFEMTNPETQMKPSPFEMYYKLHFNAKKQEWQNDDARIQYNNLLCHKKEAVAKLVSEGTVITTAMHHELEDEAIQSVCAKEKTKKSAWKVGVGAVFRKKDLWMTCEAGSSQPPSSETETKTLRNKVSLLEEEVRKFKQRDERYEKLSMFMSSKFSDFDNIISSPVSNEEARLDEELNDGGRNSESLI